MFCTNCGKSNPSEARFCGNCGTALVASARSPAPAAAAKLAPTLSAVAMAYAGFWMRLGAWFIDAVILVFISLPLSIVDLLSGSLVYDLIQGAITLFLPWLYFWLFTGVRGQTPGKTVLRIKVVDREGNVPGLGRAALREIVGKTVSTIVLFLGFVWIAWDKEKQGWHDKIAGTHVVRAIAGSGR